MTEAGCNSAVKCLNCTVKCHCQRYDRVWKTCRYSFSDPQLPSSPVLLTCRSLVETQPVFTSSWVSFLLVCLPELPNSSYVNQSKTQRDLELQREKSYFRNMCLDPFNALQLAFLFVLNACNHTLGFVASSATISPPISLLNVNDSHIMLLWQSVC